MLHSLGEFRIHLRGSSVLRVDPLRERRPEQEPLVQFLRGGELLQLGAAVLHVRPPPSKVRSLRSAKRSGEHLLDGAHLLAAGFPRTPGGEVELALFGADERVARGDGELDRGLLAEKSLVAEDDEAPAGENLGHVAKHHLLQHDGELFFAPLVLLAQSQVISPLPKVQTKGLEPAVAIALHDLEPDDESALAHACGRVLLEEFALRSQKFSHRGFLVPRPHSLLAEPLQAVAHNLLHSEHGVRVLDPLRERFLRETAEKLEHGSLVRLALILDSVNKHAPLVHAPLQQALIGVANGLRNLAHELHLIGELDPGGERLRLRAVDELAHGPLDHPRLLHLLKPTSPRGGNGPVHHQPHGAL